MIWYVVTITNNSLVAKKAQCLGYITFPSFLFPLLTSNLPVLSTVSLLNALSSWITPLPKNQSLHSGIPQLNTTNTLQLYCLPQMPIREWQKIWKVALLVICPSMSFWLASSLITRKTLSEKSTLTSSNRFLKLATRRRDTRLSYVIDICM